MSKQPILLMSFAANDLAGISVETEKIWTSVNNQKEVVPQKLENTDIVDLADAVIDAGKDLFMFHFGGHAEEGKIVLDGFKDLDKIRLSRLLLPKNHNIQIVFLNGCLSYGQVDIFTAKGVKAVIATNVKVNDGEAVRMSAYFYKLFFEKEYSLKEAFETAEATVGGNNSFVTIVNPGETSKLHPSWTLFIHAYHKEIIDWTLKDFLKKGQQKPANEETIPDRDMVGTQQIGRQINMGENSTYIENQNNSSKSIVQNLVAQGKLMEALSSLENHFPDAANEIILIKGRLNQLNKNARMSILSSADENVERNKIRAAILSINDGH